MKDEYRNRYLRASWPLLAVTVVGTIVGVVSGTGDVDPIRLMVSVVAATLAGIAWLSALAIGLTVERDLKLFRAGQSLGRCRRRDRRRDPSHRRPWTCADRKLVHAL